MEVSRVGAMEDLLAAMTLDLILVLEKLKKAWEPGCCRLASS